MTPRPTLFNDITTHSNSRESLHRCWRVAGRPVHCGKRGVRGRGSNRGPPTPIQSLQASFRQGPQGVCGQGPGGPMHTLPPLAGCTGMQMRARVTSGGPSSAIFSFWRCREEGTGSRGAGSPRPGSRRAGRRQRARRARRQAAGDAARPGRPAVGTAAAGPRRRPRPARPAASRRPRPAPPTPRPLASPATLSARGSRPAGAPRCLQGRVVAAGLGDGGGGRGDGGRHGETAGRPGVGWGGGGRRGRVGRGRGGGGREAGAAAAGPLRGHPGAEPRQGRLRWRSPSACPAVVPPEGARFWKSSRTAESESLFFTLSLWCEY